MRIHCVTVVRDEADIVGHTLDAALEWADAIHVLDNGSTDGTWELLQGYAARESRVVLAGRYEGPFQNELRGEVANRVAAGARRGDWWCRLDADELYVDDPRETLRGVPSRFGVVYGVSIEYLFTEVDLHAYETDPKAYVANWSPETLRHYVAAWSEIRFVRHRPGVPWRTWPVGTEDQPGAPQRVRLRHFQFRSPPQIERRLKTRRAESKEGAFVHEKRVPWAPREELWFPVLAPNDPQWKSRILRSDALHFDAHDGQYEIDWDALPAVQPGLPRWRRAWGRFRGRI